MTHPSGSRFRSSALCAGVLLVIAGSSAAAATFQVNSTDDAVDAAPGDGTCLTASGTCSLRAAIQEANAHAGPDSVLLPAGTYTLKISGPAEDAAATGDLDITDDLLLVGAGASVTIVDGAQLDRVFHVDPLGKGVSAELRGITIRNGKTQLISFVSGDGGGVLLGTPYTLGGPYPSGSLTLTDCIVRDSVSATNGGGLANNSGTMTLLRTQVVGNVSGRQGGGIVNGNISRTTIDQSTVADNTSFQEGGGVFSSFGDSSSATAVKVLSSTFSGNKGTSGGGLYIYRGLLDARNCTISNNTATGPGSYGGGINVSQGTATLVSCTITGNHSSLPQSGGGAGGLAGGPAVTIENTLAAGNTTAGGGPDCAGTFASAGHNLIGDRAGCALTGTTTGNILGADAKLGPLADNGGSTLTHALLTGSPAIDSGDPARPGSGGTACPASDQRGFLRPQGSACDIGALESLGGFRVSGVLPRSAANAGWALTLISGEGFAPGATAKLVRQGQPDVPASRVTVSSDALLTASFELNGVPTGAWDVVVTQADGTAVTLPSGFTVEAARAPDLWAEILGPSQGRPGATGVYVVLFGNRGNVDALGVPLSISAPGGLTATVLSTLFLPPPNPGQPTIDWSVAHVDVTPDAGAINIPLLLANVPAGSTGTVFLTVSLPGSAHSGDAFGFDVDLGTPYFTAAGALDPAARDAFVAGAQLIASQILGATIDSSHTVELTQTITDQLQSVIDVGRAAAVDGAGTMALYSLGQLATDQAITEVLRISPWAIQPARLPPTPSAQLRGGGEPPPPGPCVLVIPKGGLCPAGCSCSSPERNGPPPLPSDCQKPQDVLAGKCKLTPAMCEAMPGFKKSSDGSQCLPTNCTRSRPTSFNPDPSCRTYPLRAVVSKDPNDKSGVLGAGDAHYVSPTLPLLYDVEFENAPSATAPAQVVDIQDTLDPSLVDPGTFTPLSVHLGRAVLQLQPGVMPYLATVDRRPAQDLLVRFDVLLDTGAATVRWHLASLDPGTLELLTDPLGGFLPPNTSPPAGEGSVTFSIKPKAGLATGTRICNQASIVFDTNATLATRPFCNTIDATKPVSHVAALPAEQTSTSFTVSWSGTDEGAGIGDYTVYVSEDGSTPTPWMAQTTTTSATFTGQLGKSYAFFSVARDQVGNVQDMPAAPDTTTRLGATPGPTSPASSGKSGCNATGDASGSPSLIGLLVLATAMRARRSRGPAPLRR